MAWRYRCMHMPKNLAKPPKKLDQRDQNTRQKRPKYQAKEAKIPGKSGQNARQKRPKYQAKEAKN